jgi:hypothetical protein
MFWPEGSRRRGVFERGEVWVVSREGLVALKKLRDPGKTRTTSSFFRRTTPGGYPRELMHRSPEDAAAHVPSPANTLLLQTQREASSALPARYPLPPLSPIFRADLAVPGTGLEPVTTFLWSGF